MSIGDTLPTPQQRLIPLLGVGFKLAVVTGVLALGARWVAPGTAADIAAMIHCYGSYAFGVIVASFFVLHIAYTFSLRGGYVFKITLASGITVSVVGLGVVVIALLQRPELSNSPASLSAHVLGALLIPVMFQRHVIRAIGARGN